jgi:glycyl-tRNA synthetase beta chain
LANAFICTANIDAIDPAVVVDGNRKVLAARLSDARFFWEQDQKKTLAEHAKGLSRITFHEKLGTVADKVDRVAKLARWLVESDIVTPAQAGVSGGSALTPEMPAFAGMTKNELADMAEQAARLCKADLVTEMVGEFPELQGLMGGYYAAKEGLPQEVAEAIRDHYKPVGQGDDVPTAPVTVAVSLADKLDTLLAFFLINQPPSGSKDPFALRRASLAAIRQIEIVGLRLSLRRVFEEHYQAVFEHYKKAGYERKKRESGGGDITQAFGHVGPSQPNVTKATELLDFFADRLKVQQREAGVRHDLIDAVFALGGEDDLVRLLARVHALQAFVTTEDGANLLAGYKRAANILKKEGWDTQSRLPGLDPGSRSTSDADEEAGSRLGGRDVVDIGISYTPEPAERALIDALAAAAPRASEAVEAERFADAMAALATLRAPIDRFFEEVTVNDEEAEKRAARLALLARFRDAVHRVADFSRIEG